MSPILLLGFSWNKSFWIFPLDHAEIRLRFARPSVTSPHQFLLQHYPHGRRTKCIVGSDKEKQRWSHVTPNDKLLLAPSIIICATVGAKVTEGMSANLRFYHKRHGEITYLVTQECQVAWITVREITESPSSSALVTRLEHPLVWKWSHVRVLLLRSRTRWPCCRPTNRDFPWPCRSKASERWWNYILHDVRNLSSNSRNKCVQPVLLACQSTQSDWASSFCWASTWKQETFTVWLCSGFQEVSVKVD